METEKKRLPVGYSNFNEIIENDLYFVDKSLFIKDIIDSKSKILLFARPRRFGKTLNMNMLKSFFEIENAEKNKKCFQGLAISSAGEKYTEKQGKYPVIFLSLKDVKFSDWKEALSDLKETLRTVFDNFYYLLESPKLNESEREYFREISVNRNSDVSYVKFLLNLSSALKKHHGMPAILLIDEYDTPIQSSFTYGYYDKMIEFMRAFLGSALKDNTNLYIAVLTGILRVPKESIFSGLNNLKVNTVLDDEYSDYFGFTQRDVDEMAEYYDSADKLTEIKEWYDGYKFGMLDIYNPWSVLIYFDRKCKPQPYWVNTSANEIIKDILKKISKTDKDKMLSLISGNTVESQRETNVVYGDIEKGMTEIFSFLLMTGYLKAVGKSSSQRRPLYSLKIPNTEIECIYENEIIDNMSQALSGSYFVSLAYDIMEGRIEEFGDKLRRIAEDSLSYYDTHENFYHGFILGLTAIMNEKYQQRSNRESGKGRFDLAFFPKTKENLPGIVMEFKVSDSEDALEKTAAEAL